MSDSFTTRQAGEIITAETGVTIVEWQVRRLFEDGTLPEPPKFAGKRIISPNLFPAIKNALRSKGWLPAEVPANA